METFKEMRLKSKEFYTDEQDSILLKDIVSHKDADAFWVDGQLSEHRNDTDSPAAFRLDTLLAKLPEWEVNVKNHEVYFSNFDLLHCQEKLIEVLGSRGQQAIKACVQLLVLLKKENG